MAYDRINWENTPSHVTPLSAENLNTMDEAIDNIDEELNRVGVKAINLEARMDTAETNITNIDEELTEQDTYAKGMGAKTLQHETDIATLQGQVTTIISGATPAGNEVTDIRTAENGTTYDTAGNAVRAQVRQMIEVQDTQPTDPGNKLWIDESGYDDETQVPTWEEFSELKSDLINIDKIPLSYTLTPGKGINYSTGEEGNNSGMSATSFIQIDMFDTIEYRRIGLSSSGSFGIAFYDSNKTYISGRNSQTNTGSLSYVRNNIITVPDNVKYVRFTTLSNTETKGEFFAYGYFPIAEGQRNATKMQELTTGNVQITGFKSGAILLNGETADIDTPVTIQNSGTFRCAVVPCQEGDVFTITATGNSTAHAYGFLDTNKNVISTSGASTSEVNTIVYAPEGSAYLVINDVYDGVSFTGVPLHMRVKTTPFRAKITEFERFTITNDVSWWAFGSTTVGNTEPQNPVNTRCIIALPDSYSADGNPVPLIMFGHGAGGYITDSSWYGNSGNFLTMIRAFTSAGFAVFDVDNTRGREGGFPDWGCFPLMTAYVKAWEYIKKNYNVQHELFVVSDSMGTAASLNMLKWYGNHIRTAIQIAPRPICKQRYATLSDQVKKEMLVAYGIEPDTILDDETFVIPDDSVFTDDYIGFYHWENIVTVDEKPVLMNLNFPPIKVIVGGADTNFLTETREYYQALKNAGNVVNYREVAGAEHNISFLPNYSGLTTEAVNWLKRFI